MKRCLLLLPFLALLSGCYTVPETGRKSFMMVSSGWETELGASEFSALKKSRVVSNDPQMNATVQRVGTRIAAVVGDALPNAKWEFVVFEDDSVNAFALPGGKVGVHTGLFRVAHTDDELAVVMGHEIAHAVARHGAERMSQTIALGLGAVALDVAMHDQDSSDRQLALAAYGLAGTGLVILPYSRLNENEADEIGLRYAARAGYDPRAAIDFWTRMKQESEGKSKPPEWMSTHPSDDTRIRKLEQFMPIALEEYYLSTTKQ